MERHALFGGRRRVVRTAHRPPDDPAVGDDRTLQPQGKRLFRERHEQRLQPHRAQPQQHRNRRRRPAYAGLRPARARPGVGLDAGRGRRRLAPHPVGQARRHHRLVRRRPAVHADPRAADQWLAHRPPADRRRQRGDLHRRSPRRGAAGQGLARRPGRSRASRCNDQRGAGGKRIFEERPPAAPINWAATNAGTSAGRMPAKVSDRLRATVIAGLAKLVDEVNQ